MDFTQIENDAKALASALFGDAKTAVVALLGAVADSTETAVPTLSQDALNTLLDFVPGAVRGLVAGFVSGQKANLDADAIKAIKYGLSIALARINAIKL